MIMRVIDGIAARGGRLLLPLLALALLVAACTGVAAPVATDTTLEPARVVDAVAVETADPAEAAAASPEAQGEPNATTFQLPTPTPEGAQASQVELTTASPDQNSAGSTATPEAAGAPSAQAGVAATPFPVGNDLTIAALRARTFTGSDIVIEQTLSPGANYDQYIASYLSDGFKIYGLLTVPYGDAPEGGFPAIVFNHGYIPPASYRTTERYVYYVDALAQNGFVVFKIDMRGFGNSEGEPSGAYFSPDYTVDAINALKSLQRLDYVNPDRIGMWGHSMAGNLVLRAMEVEPDVKAGVIWAGAVYSYEDMAKYAIDDPSFRREDQPTVVRRGTLLRDEYGAPDLTKPYWRAVSLTENIEYLQAPLQINHAANDPVVNIGYSEDLATVLEATGKEFEFNVYEGGGHNIDAPYFGQAMQNTVAFFKAHL